MVKTKVFFFHYNKPASLKAGKVQISLHYSNTCHILDNVECRVSTKGKIRKTAPRFVMTGRASDFSFENGVVTIS